MHAKSDSANIISYELQIEEKFWQNWQEVCIYENKTKEKSNIRQWTLMIRIQFVE